MLTRSYWTSLKHSSWCVTAVTHYNPSTSSGSTY